MEAGKRERGRRKEKRRIQNRDTVNQEGENVNNKHPSEIQINQKRLLLVRELIAQPVKSINQSLSIGGGTLDNRPLSIANLGEAKGFGNLCSVQSSGNILLVRKYQQRCTLQLIFLFVSSKHHAHLQNGRQLSLCNIQTVYIGAVDDKDHRVYGITRPRSHPPVFGK